MSGIVIRPGADTDHSYVLDSFWRGYTDSPFTTGVPAQLLIQRMSWLLSSPRWRLAVAHPADEPDLIVGWVVFEPDASTARIAWVNVRLGPGWRRRGIGRALARHAGVTARGQAVECAFLDPAVQQRVRERHGLKLHFRPYLPDVALLDARTAALAAAEAEGADGVPASL